MRPTPSQPTLAARELIAARGWTTAANHTSDWVFGEDGGPLRIRQALWSAACYDGPDGKRLVALEVITPILVAIGAVLALERCDHLEVAAWEREEGRTQNQVLDLLTAAAERLSAGERAGEEQQP